MWWRGRSRVDVQIGDFSTPNFPPADPNPLETGRFAGSKINLIVAITTRTYLVPGTCQAIIFTFELPISIDRGVVELAEKYAGRQS